MNNDDSKLASLCKGGCGFYGSEIFNNMCSKCYKDSQMARNSENDKCPAGKSVDRFLLGYAYMRVLTNAFCSADSKDASIITSSSSSTSNPSLTHPICTSTTNTTTRTSTIPADVTAVPSRPSRKHRRSASPIPEKKSLAVTTAGTSSSSKDTAAVAIASSMNQSTMAATAAATLTAAHSNGTSVAAATSAGNEYPRPPQSQGATRQADDQ
ncbi:hypothetical protein BX666DRAFT_1874145 [Dichotomocladium elegans]|nr:hypothetical protein BX666DRAFT_1874145 [Dichotomocladium elegans]